MGKAEYELAGFGTRFIAFFIDGIIISIITGALTGVGGSFGGGLGILIDLAYYWYFWTRNNGQSPGKMLMNIRVVKIDGSALEDGDAIARFIGYVISCVVICLGFIWVLFDEKNQGWHDKMAGTYVVKV